VATAVDRVWLSDEADPRARTAWRTGTGRYRNLGDSAPPDAQSVEPSLEDAYLLLRGAVSSTEVPA